MLNLEFVAKLATMVQLPVRRGHRVVAAPEGVHLSPRGDFWGAEGAAFAGGRDGPVTRRVRTPSPI